MRTIIKDAYWKIFREFYLNKNTALHLREISRKIKLDQSALTRHLNNLVKDKVLNFKEEGNLKQFYINKQHIKNIFPLYDEERLGSLPLLRKNAIKFYMKELDERPVFLIVFGSTAKKTSKEDSDINIIAVFNKKTDTKDARDYAQAQSGIIISEFQMDYKGFMKEIKLKQDQVIQLGIETGFPVYNNGSYYGALYNE